MTIITKLVATSVEGEPKELGQRVRVRDGLDVDVAADVRWLALTFVSTTLVTENLLNRLLRYVRIGSHRNNFKNTYNSPTRHAIAT
jgi:hypothetical protein